MLTKEEYQYVNGFRGILELFDKSGEYIGGADNLISWHENKYGERIDRGCQGCIAGFLKFSFSMLKQYDKQNGSTER
jgi:hypothetical protein